MAKIALLITLAALQAMTLPELQAEYKTALEKDADPSLDQPALLAELLKNAKPAPEPKKTKAAEDSIEFDYKGKTYKVNDKAFPKVHIPNIGERTAAEIGVDPKAQEYLVKNDCIGTVISLVD